MAYKDILPQNTDVIKTMGKVFVRINMDTYVEKYGYILRAPGKAYSLTPLSRLEDSVLDQDYHWDPDPEFHPEDHEWVLAELVTGAPILVYRDGSALKHPLLWDNDVDHIEHVPRQKDFSDWSEDYVHVGIPEAVTLEHCIRDAFGEEYWEKYSQNMALNEISVDDWKAVHGWDDEERVQLPVKAVDGEYRLTDAATYCLHGRAFAYIAGGGHHMLDLATGHIVYTTHEWMDWELGLPRILATDMFFELPRIPGVPPADADNGYLMALEKAGIDYKTLTTTGKVVRR